MTGETPEQGHRCGRIAQLVAADYIEVDVADLAVRLSGFDAVKPIHCLAGGPGSRSRGAAIKRSVGIAEFCRLSRSHYAGVDERRGGIGDLRVSGVGGNRDGDPMLPRQGDEIGGTKAVVSNLDDVTQRTSFYFLRQKL